MHASNREEEVMTKLKGRSEADAQTHRRGGSRHAIRLGLAGLALFGAVACASDAQEPALDEVASVTSDLTGNIHPGAIQIDGPSAGADLFPGTGTPLNVGATLDWVADSLANSGTGCLDEEGNATCIEPGVTGAAGGTGHWNGVRIVDGIGGADENIFLTGGKENEFETWNIGPGSVGSSKYDIVQAYVANNQDMLFFGMERRGNNGTTFFDFEFNQLAPGSEGCPANTQIPCRSEGDVLFGFEMQGSGGSGSATPYIFTWDGTAFVPGTPTGMVSSINTLATTAGGPWGHVDSHGDWVLGPLDRFQFAEAAAPIALLPGVDACGGEAFVQVRTRSSATDTSDLKDTTRIFHYQFLNLSAEAGLDPTCEEGFAYHAQGLGVDGEPLPNATCAWTFSNGATSSTCSGVLAAPPGTYTGTVVISDASLPGCGATVETDPVTVYAALGVDAQLDATCSSSFDYLATVTGGSSAGVAYGWHFSGGGSTTPSSSTSPSGSVLVGTPGVAYTGSVIVTDLRTDLPPGTCTAFDGSGATPYAPIMVSISPSDSSIMCTGIEAAGDDVTYTAAVTGGDGSYVYSWHGCTPLNGSCVVDPADTDFCAEASVYVTVDDGSSLCAAQNSETESYAKVTIVTSTNN